MPEWIADIGMEVHAELLTESKMFCGCRNAFGGEPNTRCCPVCTAMPGSLPVINRKAVEHVIRAALALNCHINRNAKFDRKNYFYPDLPKGYQISQYDQPIGEAGWLDIEVDGATRRVNIRRVHLEEDTGKLFHVAGQESEVDYNRSGVPLMEIVTEFPPDMHTPEEARAYLSSLRAILTYIGVSDGKMEQGSLRCEPNLSVRPADSEKLGVKTEIKNLNSFRAVYRGIQYEIERMTVALKEGEQLVQETRGWNEVQSRTFPQRSKEEAHDYRYFPDPDLLPVCIEDSWIEEIRSTMPELPAQALARFISEYGLPAHDAGLLTQTPVSAEFFESAARICNDAKAVSNWMMGDFTRLLNAAAMEIGESKVSPDNLGALITLINDGTISGKMAKELFEKMFETGADPRDLAREAGPQITDGSALATLLDSTIKSNRPVWDGLVAGDDKKLGFMIGQVMKASEGKANPAEVSRLLKNRLELERAS